MNFLLAIKLSSDILQATNIYKLWYKKIILKFVVVSIALARTGTILPVVREITHIKRYENV